MNYDVIVVGGGAAGLTAAAYSARSGKRVGVFEKQDNFGGLVQTVERNGFYFDIGLRAIENSGIVLPMVAELELPLEYVRSRVSVGIADRVITIDAKSSLDEYRQLLERFCANSSSDIARILEVVRRIMRGMDVLYGIDNPLFKDLTKDYRYVFRTLLPWSIKFLFTIGRINRMDEPIETFLEQLTSDATLRDLVGQHFFRYTPAFFAMSYFSVYLDYLYPKGGTGALMALLEENGIRNGVEFHRKRSIVAIDPAAKTATEESGEIHHYGRLIWAADSNALYRATDESGIADAEVRDAVAARRRALAGVPGGDSVFSLFLSVDAPPEHFRAIAEGHFFYTPEPKGLGALRFEGLESLLDRYDSLADPVPEVQSFMREFLRLNTFEISIPVLKDTSMAPPQKTGIIVSFLLDYTLVRKVSETGWYEEFNTFCSKEIVGILSRTIYPGLDRMIIDQFTTTPLTIERYTGNTGGAITGWALGPGPVPATHRMQDVSKSVLTPIPDVYQAGQWTYSPSGLPMAFLTGKLAANRAIK